MASTGGGWTQLRQQIRSLEQQTETVFHRYSQYASMSNLPATPDHEEEKSERQILDLLQQREALINQLSRLLDSESALTSSALKHSHLSRHREVLHEHKRELQRLKDSIAEIRKRANLYSSVREDIESYRAANPEDAEAEYMLEERRRIDNSHSMADSVLAQAYSINENFGIQRDTIASVNRRIVGAASQVPGLNSLMNRIGAKKRRDGIILGSFIAFCFLMVLYFR